ncbi:CRISPR-associated protein Csx19 [Candidatus Chloroploca sp. Khr17]|uniref:type III-D CRISPR-associated protein Csx19 n=1 Tax=Candidatus Chloroploca sp. Khr17 TaxID=2496869 RepID=UPI00101CE648|nr:CRISPR-associated protein Csx19 [Candidatus Chloroploca sp. Khr17]
MTGSDHSVQLFGCDLLPLDAVACEQYLAWLIGEAGTAEPNALGSARWLLAHSLDGITWGRYERTTQTWLLGHTIAPEISPPLQRQMLLELRIFGAAGEVLIWRTDDGLRGRVLREDGEAYQRDNPLRPADEERIVLGRHILETHHTAGFTHVRDGTAKEQVLPLVVSEQDLRSGKVRLVIRNYYEADATTGVVRIAATRLVKLTIGGNDGA